MGAAAFAKVLAKAVEKSKSIGKELGSALKEVYVPEANVSKVAS